MPLPQHANPSSTPWHQPQQATRPHAAPQPSTRTLKRTGPAHAWFQSPSRTADQKQPRVPSSHLLRPAVSSLPGTPHASHAPLCHPTSCPTTCRSPCNVCCSSRLTNCMPLSHSFPWLFPSITIFMPHRQLGSDLRACRFCYSLSIRPLLASSLQPAHYYAMLYGSW